jgi:hypothetical protein
MGPVTRNFVGASLPPLFVVWAAPGGGRAGGLCAEVTRVGVSGFATNEGVGGTGGFGWWRTFDRSDEPPTSNLTLGILARVGRDAPAYADQRVAVKSPPVRAGEQPGEGAHA